MALTVDSWYEESGELLICAGRVKLHNELTDLKTKFDKGSNQMCKQIARKATFCDRPWVFLLTGG